MNKLDIFPTTIFQFQLEDEEILNESFKVVEDIKMAQFNYPHRVLSSDGDLHKREDLKPLGDITTKNIKNKKVVAKIIANQNCIVGGLSFA